MGKLDVSRPQKHPPQSCGLGAMRVFIGLDCGLRLGPVIWEPTQYSVGGWGHPDLGNHWLLVWVAEQLGSGASILHTLSIMSQ